MNGGSTVRKITLFFGIVLFFALLETVLNHALKAQATELLGASDYESYSR